MKRIIFTLLIAFATSYAFTSCTEDEIAPQKADMAAGGTVGDEVRR